MELQQFPEQQAQLHDSLPQLMQDAAAALQQHQQAEQANNSSRSSSDSQPPPPQQQQQPQHVLAGQLVDMIFAMAVHAFDCETAAAAAAAAGSRDGCNDHSSSGSSAVWYLSSGCVALVDAVASYSSNSDFVNIARGVSI
jgi:uncharacterized iron-regulated membrane protein